MRSQDKGGAGLWITLAILGLSIWAAFIIGRFYFDQQSIQNEVAMIGDDTLVSHRSDAKERIQKILESYGAVYEPEKIIAEVNSVGDRISISAPYKREADFMVMKYPMEFQVNVQREAQRATGVINQIQDALDSSSNTAAQKYQKSLQNAGQPAPE